MQQLLAAWDGQSVSIHHDRVSGAWMIICVHSTRLGPSAGGTRMKHYASLDEAVNDGLRLSAAMTLKFAAVGFPLGGGKAVIALPTPEQPQGEARRRLLREYGTFVASLGGVYSASADMNTSAEDMDVIGEVCKHVFCKTEAAGGSGDTGPDTGVGVFHGMRGACRHAFGSDDLRGRTVLVQGAGGVGGKLIELLLEAGAKVSASDVDPARLARFGSSITSVRADQALTTACDVLAPCATGGMFSERTIPGLRCKVIAGGANNQLEKPSDSALLKSRGIAYAPDFVINAGGVLHGGGIEVEHWTRAQLDARLVGLGDVIYEILQTADRESIDADTAARRLAQARIDAAR
jgi:leucine dehydrogenase